MDLAVSTAMQLTMVGRVGVDEVVPVNAGRAAAETAPDAVAAALIAAATPEFEWETRCLPPLTSIPRRKS